MEGDGARFWVGCAYVGHSCSLPPLSGGGGAKDLQITRDDVEISGVESRGCLPLFTVSDEEGIL